MKILLGYSYYEYSVDIRAWNEAWLARLRAAGIQVEGTCLTLKPPGGRLSWAELDERWRKRDRELLAFYERLARQAEGYDVLVNYNGINLHPEFVPQLPTFNVYCCFDDPESSEGLSRPVAAAYDLCMVGNIAELATYRQWGVKEARFIPNGFRPDDFDPTLTREQILNGKRDVDLTLLCERTSAWRKERLDRFAAAFPNGAYYGYGWPKGFLPECQRVPLLQRTKIGVNLHNSTGPINFRTFYLPANGVLQICDNKSNLGHIYEVNREVVGFETMEEAIDLVHYYLAHDQESRQIAVAGWERARRDYNEVASFQRLISAVEEVKAKRALATQSNSPFSPEVTAVSLTGQTIVAAKSIPAPALAPPTDWSIGRIFLHTDQIYSPDQWFHRFEYLLKEHYRLPYQLVDLLTENRLKALTSVGEGDALIGRFGHAPEDQRLIRPIFGQLCQVFQDRIFPTRGQYFYYDDKLRQAELFRQKNYPAPRSTWVKSADELSLFLRQQDLSFPLVVKKPHGAGSSNVGLVRSMDRVPYPCLVQEFCAGNDRDWRVNVIGDRVMGFERLVRDNDFRASGSGRIIYPKDLPSDLVQLAYRISQENHFPSMAYDFVRQADKWVVLEMSYAYTDTAVRDCAYYYDMATGAKREKAGAYPEDFVLADFLGQHYGVESRTGQLKGTAARKSISQSPAVSDTPPPSGAQVGLIGAKNIGREPRVLVIADVPNWIFERHVRMLHRFLGDEFDFTLGFKDESFREDDFDLIYPLEWNLVIPAQIRFPRKWITGIRSHLSWDKEPFPLVIERLRTQFQRVHVVSKRLLRIFEPHVPRVICLSHGVDTEFFTPRTGADLSGKKLRVGWAGNRLSSSKKGFQEIIEPLGLLPGVELVFCGYQDRNLSLEEMRDFYSSLDAYVCASDFEGNNNSLLEAAAMQRALITTDNGAVPEYLQHERSAIIVERKAEAFVQAVFRLRDDPSLRVALGREARVAVQRHFEWKAMAEQYRFLFQEVLGESGFGKPARPGAQSPSPHIPDSTTSKVEPASSISVAPETAAVVAPPVPGCASFSPTSGFNASKPAPSLETALTRYGHEGKEPRISVVLPTFNRPEILTRCLEGFARQTVSRLEFEVVITDDGSQPPVQNAVEAFADRLQICYRYQPNAGLASARNACIDLARAPLLALHDDDNVPAPDYLAGCLAFHEAYPAEADILLAQFVAHPELERTPILEWAFDIANGVIGFPLPGMVHPYIRFYGGTSSCKRSLFRYARYDDRFRFGFEDIELAYRLNQKLTLRVHYHPEVLSYLVRGFDFPGLFRRSYREGRSMRRVFETYQQAAFEIVPPEANQSETTVKQIGPNVGVLQQLVRRLELEGEASPVKIAFGDRTLKGREALNACYTLCTRYARAQGWMDLAAGTAEDAGLTSLNRILENYGQAKASAPVPSSAVVAGGTLPFAAAGRKALVYFHSNPYPARSGAHRGILGTLQSLRSLGYEVTLISSDLFTDQPWTAESVEGLRRDKGIHTRIYLGSSADRSYVAAAQAHQGLWGVHTPPGLAAFFREAFRTIRPELVLVNYAYCAELVADAEFAQATLVVQMHDLVSLSGAMAANAWAQLGRPPVALGSVSPAFLREDFFRQLGLQVDPEEYRRYGLFDGVIACSASEASLVRANAPAPAVETIAVAVPATCCANTYSAPPVCVVFGNPFNLQGYLYFAQRVLPQVRATLPGFTLRIVGDAGRYVTPCEGMELMGFVPELGRIYADASFAVCPLLGGTGQQVKIVEAMANGLAVVSLADVSRSSPIEHGVDGFVAQNADEFVRYVLQLAQDPALCRRMGQAARLKLQRDYSPEQLTRQVEGLLEQAKRRRQQRLGTKHHAGARQEAPATPVVWLAPWQNPSGYCSEALAFARGLGDARPLELVDVACARSPEFVQGLTREMQALLRQKLYSKPQLAGKIVVEHMPASGFSRLPGAAWCIGRTMFETDRVPVDWVAKCNQLDEIWVPSRFNLETFAASGVQRAKLHWIPEAVDETLFDPARHEPLPLPNLAACNFLSVFEWSTRKGWDVLLASYLREFSAADDVCLYLRTYVVNRPDADPQAELGQVIRHFAELLNLGDKAWPRIEILAGQLPTRELPRLYRSVNCLVAPSRGEGWGRPHNEAMMMGVPVIATNWSGNTEFMTAENSYLLDFELVEVGAVEQEFAHYRGHRWAMASETHLRQLLRQVQQHPQEARERGAKAREHVLRHFSLKPVAARLQERLAVIDRHLAEATAKPVNTAWEGTFLDFGSLSHVNRELTRQLVLRPGMALTRVGNSTLTNGYASAPELLALRRHLVAQAPGNTEVTVRHAWPPNWSPASKGALVVIQPWEYGVLPADWVAQAGKVQQFWVPSEYVRQVYIGSGVPAAKVKLVPNGIDPDRFHPGAPALQLSTRKTFKFLFVGGTIHRKGPDVLLQAFMNAFTSQDDVCLVIKDFGGKSFYAGQTLQQTIQASQQQPNAPEILYLTDELAPEALPGLYTACDCLVHPYRGEGFGLPILEAMACGLPVIVTAGGAADDFATTGLAYHIPAQRRSIGREVSGMPLVGEGWLLEPSVEETAARMRHVFGHREEARAKGQAASQAVRRDWTWERAAALAHQHLQSLVADTGAAAAISSPSLTCSKAAPMVLPPCALIGHLAQSRMQLGNKKYQTAWELTLAAIRARPYHPEAYLLLAGIALAAGNAASARRCAQHARDLAPAWKPVKRFLKSNLRGNAKPDWMVLPEALAASRAPRLSVCLIVRNEEKFLAQCLTSVRGLADQIILVDTGSTDRTVAIAKEHGAEVYDFAWCDDFSAARNAALEHATGDWVLMLDADEELPSDSHAALRKLLAVPSVMAWRLPIIDIGRENEGCCYVPRLYRNAPALFYIGRVHEQVFSSIEVRRQEWGLDSRLGDAALRHHGYLPEVVKDRNKIERNLRLLEKVIVELPDEPNLLMNYGLELVRSGQLETGMEQYRKAFDLMSAQAPSLIIPETREMLLTQFCTQLTALRRFDEIIRALTSPLAQAGGLTASLHFALGLAYLELKQLREAAEQMRQCLAKRDQPSLAPINPEIRKAGPHHCLALCLTHLGEAEAAADEFRLAIKDDPQSRPARFDYARYLATRNELVEALDLLFELTNQKGDDLNVWLMGGQIALRRPEFLELALDWTSEAQRHFPENPVVLRQRAEVLMLANRCVEAVPLWRQLRSETDPVLAAALVLCETVAKDGQYSPPPHLEAQISREFVKWYERLIQFNNRSTVEAVNARIDSLRSMLPTVAQMLEKALAEACVTAVA